MSSSERYAESKAIPKARFLHTLHFTWEKLEQYARGKLWLMIVHLEKLISLDPQTTTSEVVWVKAQKKLESISTSNTRGTQLVEGMTSVSYQRNTRNWNFGVMRVKQAILMSCDNGDRALELNADRTILVFTKKLRPIHIGDTRNTYEKMYLQNKARQLHKRTSENRLAVLGAYYSDSENYFHFWCDTIGDWWFLQKMGLSEENIDKYILQYAGKSWQREIIEMCGIKEQKLLRATDFSLVKCKELTLPFRPKGGRTNPRWLVQAMRESSRFTADSTQKATRRIYIDRRAANRRQLINENDLINVLVSKNFEIVDCSQLLVREQQELFASSKIVVSPHGAALTNIAWMRRGSLLIELLPEGWGFPCYFDMANQAELRYESYTCRQLDAQSNPKTAPVVLDVDKFEAFLDDILAEYK